jgi:hypothetical protein
MGFWTEEDGGAHAPKMPSGYHQAKIIKVMLEDKDGNELRTRNGDSQMRVVFANDAGEEVMQHICITGKGNFKLRMLCSRCGMNIQRMDQEGVKPEAFEDAAFARKQLLGRTIWLNVDASGQYPEVEFVKAEDLPAHAIKKQEPAAGSDPPPIDESSLPF